MIKEHLSFKPNSRILLSFIQLLIVALSLFSVVSADEQAPSNPDSSDGGLRWGKYVIGVILLAIGIVFLFFGKKLIKILVFIGGFLGLAMLTLTIAGLAVDLNTLTQTQNTILWICTGVLGLIGGLMAWCVWQFGLAIIGGLFGYQISRFILRTNFIDKSNTQLWIILACILIGAALMFFFSNVLIVVVTSFMGADLFMCGIDFMANVGYIQFRNISYESGKIIAPTAGVWAMMGSALILTLIGCLIQFKA